MGAAAAVSLPGFWHFYTLPRVPRIPNINYLQLAESYPCQSMRQIIVTCCGQSEAATYPTPGIKMKTHSYNTFVCVCVFLKKLRFQNSHYSGVTLSSPGLPSCTSLLLQLLLYVTKPGVSRTLAKKFLSQLLTF